jgi:hypothetical protein
MTRKRNDIHSTEFGLWLRDQKEIDSSLGFITTNLDYIWENYKTGEWMLIEEKRYQSDVCFSQRQQLKNLNKRIGDRTRYKGMHLLQFEKTSPEDGKIFLDRKEISKDQLLLFLKFQPFEL